MRIDPMETGVSDMDCSEKSGDQTPDSNMDSATETETCDDVTTADDLNFDESESMENESSGEGLTLTAESSMPMDSPIRDSPTEDSSSDVTNKHNGETSPMDSIESSAKSSDQKSPESSDQQTKPKTGSPSLCDGLILVPTTDHPLANLDNDLDPEKVEDPGKKKRRVRFLENGESCVRSYHEAPDPWSKVTTFTPAELVRQYRLACSRYNIKPISKLISQLEATADVGERYETLTLKGERLDLRHCDALEEILRRVQFKTIDLEATDLDDDSAGSIFDMLEFYDSATRLVIAYNRSIGPRGWQACSRMIKRTPSLVHLDLRSCTVTDHAMPFLGRALRIGSKLQILHLENSGISGKVLLILVAALKLNDPLRELYLADNRLMPSDGIQLGNLLKHNDRLQLLDLRNNHLQDTGMSHLCEGIEAHDQQGCGLTTLVLWNNQITQHSMAKTAQALSLNRTLETLNLGHNNLGNEGILLLKEGLLKNKSVRRLGLQSCRLFCEGAIAIAELIADSQTLVRVDLRENEIKTAGLMALSLSLKMNQSVTKLDLDKEAKKERSVKDYLEQQASLLSDISNWLLRNREHAYCVGQVQEKETEMPENMETDKAEETEKADPPEQETDLPEQKSDPPEEKTDRPTRPKGELHFSMENRSESLESPMVVNHVVPNDEEHVTKHVAHHVTEEVDDVDSGISHKRGGGRRFRVKYVPDDDVTEGISFIGGEAPLLSPTLEFPLSINAGQPGLQPILVPTDQPILVPTDQPILVPTDQAGIQPILVPTDQPILVPIDQPILVPTDHKSKVDIESEGVPENGGLPSVTAHPVTS